MYPAVRFSMTPPPAPWYASVVRRFVLAICLASGGCDLGTDAVPVDAMAGDDGPRPLDGDLVPPVGSDATLDIACWNLEWFPKDTRTVELVADLITSMELDVVVVEEVASTLAWDQLVARLPQHEGVLSTHRYSPTEYQKIGYLYRADLVSVGEPELLFTGSTYGFPRPPMKLRVTAGSFAFDMIGVHLKAGVSEDDSQRRASAMRTLEAYVRAQVDEGGEDEVVVLGDFNETINTSYGMAVMAPMLAAPDRYRFRTQELAAAGEVTYIPSGKIIDHVVTTAGFVDELGDVQAVIPRLDAQMARYEPYVSDHLPVVLSIPAPAPAP
jgi:endonuclease/exonuclease/phosphatase family metal-dependent hydrolase